MSRVAGRRTVAALALAALALSGCVSVGDGGDAGVSAATSTSATARARATTTSPPRAGAGREPTGAPVTIAFGGDVHFEGAVATRLARDPATTFGPIAGVLRRADLAIVNLETAITERGTPAAKEFTFRAPASAFAAQIAAGFPPGVMPQNYGTTLPPEDLQALVQFLTQAIGGDGGGAGGGGGGAGGQ